MSDIFISYASEDQNRVLPLVQALEKTGWTIFWDRTIPAGKTWRQIINAEIHACRCVLVVWTARSVTSEWVLEEAEIAKRKRILVPVLLDQIELPLGFGTIQAANLVAWNGSDSAPTFGRLISDIAATVGFCAPDEEVEGEKQRRTKEEPEHKREKERSHQRGLRRADEEAGIQADFRYKAGDRNPKDAQRTLVMVIDALGTSITRLSNWPTRIAGTLLATVSIAGAIVVGSRLTLGWSFTEEEITVIVLFALVLSLAAPAIFNRSKGKR